MSSRRLQLDLSQQSLTAPLEISNADLLVVGASWDPRSLACVDLIAPCPYTILLRYSNVGVSGRSGEHRAALLKWIEQAHVKSDEIAFSSENVRESFLPLWQRIAAHSRDLRRPLTVVMDLSVIPRYVSLGLIASGFLGNVVRDVYLIYQTAVYPQRKGPPRDEISIAPASFETPAINFDAEDGLLASPSMFTEGRWRTIYVPGLRGSYRPGRPRHYVIGLGFEGDDTYRVIQQQEPDVVTGIVPDPPSYDGLVDRCLRENDVLIKEWIGPDRLLRCGATDAVGVDDLLATVADAESTVCFLPVGTKPHAVGMAVRSLRAGTPMVLYRWPERHAEGGAEAGEHKYLYYVRDRAAF